MRACEIQQFAPTGKCGLETIILQIDFYRIEGKNQEFSVEFKEDSYRSMRLENREILHEWRILNRSPNSISRNRDWKIIILHPFGL